VALNKFTRMCAKIFPLNPLIFSAKCDMNWCDRVSCFQAAFLYFDFGTDYIKR
jgi:hypothetical protein